jgi:hypothetical protein
MKRLLCLLLLPEVAIGYVGIGAILMVAGYEWGYLIMGAGMVVMFGFELWEGRLEQYAGSKRDSDETRDAAQPEG